LIFSNLSSYSLLGKHVVAEDAVVVGVCIAFLLSGIFHPNKLLQVIEYILLNHVGLVLGSIGIFAASALVVLRVILILGMCILSMVVGTLI